MQSLAIYLYVAAVGFVAAGLLASFVQLVSGEPMRFGMKPESIFASIGAVLLQVLAGPAILMRNAWRAYEFRRAPRFGSAFPRLSPPYGASSRGRCCWTYSCTCDAVSVKKREPASWGGRLE